jgi:hypothetical protein
MLKSEQGNEFSRAAAKAKCLSMRLRRLGFKKVTGRNVVGSGKITSLMLHKTAARDRDWNSGLPGNRQN